MFFFVDIEIEIEIDIDIDKVRRARDAIWNAAVLAYRADEPFFLNSETAATASKLNLEVAEDE